MLPMRHASTIYCFILLQHRAIPAIASDVCNASNVSYSRNASVAFRYSVDKKTMYVCFTKLWNYGFYWSTTQYRTHDAEC